jgi:hypothetical protein
MRSCNFDAEQYLLQIILDSVDYLSLYIGSEKSQSHIVTLTGTSEG